MTGAKDFAQTLGGRFCFELESLTAKADAFRGGCIVLVRSSEAALLVILLRGRRVNNKEGILSETRLTRRPQVACVSPDLTIVSRALSLPLSDCPALQGTRRRTLATSR